MIYKHVSCTTLLIAGYSRVRIIENLRHTGFAPSVQMNGVPADVFSSSDDEDEEANPDQRSSGMFLPHKIHYISRPVK